MEVVPVLVVVLAVVAGPLVTGPIEDMPRWPSWAPSNSAGDDEVLTTFADPIKPNRGNWLAAGAPLAPLRARE
jgi:hypothetical protein